jgi:hypothetical protein
LNSINNSSDTDVALKTAIKVATARAWGWTENMSWLDVQNRIKVHIERI